MTSAGSPLRSPPSGPASSPEAVEEIGAALPESWGEPQEGVDADDSEADEKLAELSNPTKRMLGPALPPQVLLDQAAEVAEAVSSLSSE